MDDYIAAAEERQRLSSPIEVFEGKTPDQLIAESRIGIWL